MSKLAFFIEVIGFLYGLDVRKPVVKIYRGYLNRACTNLCVFDHQWLNIQEIGPKNWTSTKNRTKTEKSD